MRKLCILFVLVAGCSGDPPPVDGDRADAGGRDGGGSDGGGLDGGPGTDGGADASGDAGASCVPAHAIGDRYPAGDDCNFCECVAGGVEVCTMRTCSVTIPPCTYAGTTHDYGERFPASDGCNECVCAASGLACTRRSCPGSVDEGAILVESLDEECGVPGFTARSVIEGLPRTEIIAPFLYERAGPLYPETRPDTTVRIRIVYDGGFAACRIPMPGQEAFDIEVLVEWITADGAFDEGFHTYLRRNAGGFVDAWWIDASALPGGLHGAYDPACFDPNGLSFGAQVDPDGSAHGEVFKTCESDISLEVGSFMLGPL